MSFKVREHIIECHHIGQDGNSVKSGGQQKRLSVKQYTPLSNPSPGHGDITIIAGHANGFVREIYEPLWDDLEKLLLKRGKKIRSIWFPDICNQGASGLLNEAFKYDHVTWFDHTRDLMHLVNHFRSEMVKPIVGFGHSMGGNQIFMLSLAHPTLFSTLIMMDPIIAPGALIRAGLKLGRNTLRRRVDWPTRKAAEKTFYIGFKTWDPRVLTKFNEYALYPPPSPTSMDQPVRLTTGRFQELAYFIRPRFIYSGIADEDPIEYVNEAMVAHKIIGLVECSVLYLCGEMSTSAGPAIREDWLKRTGMMVDKRGMERRVEECVVPKAGHFVPMEAPTASAEAAAKWLDEEIGRWSEREGVLDTIWRKLPAEEKEERANEWMKVLKGKL